jgi:hypothetical protein
MNATDFASGKSVLYLLNLLNPAFSLPREIIPDFLLRRASDLEREFISKSMRRHYIGLGGLAYEMTIDRASGSMSSEPNPAGWRYFVIEYPQKENDFINVKSAPRRRLTRFLTAALISEANLQWGYESLANPENPVCPTTCCADVIHAYHDYLHQRILRQKAIQELTEGQVDGIKAIFTALEQLTEQHKSILEACELYRGSHGISINSNFRILALFATIELLVTHKPSVNETGDSLTRQIKGKLPLLSHRFRGPYSPTEWFPSAGNKIWGKLYAYRSAIAHGNQIDFESRGDVGFKELCSSRDIFFFLDDFVRRLLRHAAVEPQLYLDIKEC